MLSNYQINISRTCTKRCIYCWHLATFSCRWFLNTTPKCSNYNDDFLIFIITIQTTITSCINYLLRNFHIISFDFSSVFWRKNKHVFSLIVAIIITLNKCAFEYPSWVNLCGPSLECTRAGVQSSSNSNHRHPNLFCGKRAPQFVISTTSNSNQPKKA